jgi:hypothetical protein
MLSSNDAPNDAGYCYSNDGLTCYSDYGPGCDLPNS